MHTNLYRHTYTYIIIYIQRYTYLNARPCVTIPILKKHIRYNIWTEKCVDLYLYDKPLQFALLEESQVVLTF